MLTTIDVHKFRQILIRTIGLPVVIMLLLSAGLLLQIQTILNATSWVDHTDRVIAQANEVQRLLIDLETGIRGYLLTEDVLFLEPYTNAEGSIDAVFNQLAQLVADNPEQAKQLKLIQADYAAWNSDAQALLSLYASGGAYQAADVNLPGKQKMDALRTHLATFIRTEETLRDNRIKALQNTTQWIIGSSMVVLVILGIALALYNRRQLRVVAETYQHTLTVVQTQAEALQASEERFRVTLTSLGDAVIATDTNGQITFLNTAAETLTGWAAAEAIGRNVREVFHIINEYTREFVENPIIQTLQEGSNVGLANHTLLIGRNGTEYPIDDSSAPIHNGAGAVIGAVLVFRDISEKMSAEEGRRQSENRLRIALQSSPITVYAQDRDLRYTWLYNPAPGYNATDTIGKLDSDITTPEDAAQLMALKREVLKTGNGIRTEVHVAGLTGNMYFDLTIEPLRDAKNNIIGVTGAAHDITARKHAEQERFDLLAREQAARVEAQEAVQARDIFFSVAAHELKTPLTSLLGNIQLIQRRATREGFLSERDQRALTVVIAQTQRLNRMIEALLDVSRLESGQLSLIREVFDLRTLVEQVVLEIQPTLTEHTLSYQAADHSLMIEGDTLRLEQVLQNLIQNAIKYSPAGGAIQINSYQETDTACVAVIDHGIGIPQEAQDRLFTRFYRASNVEERHITGMGIGLYVVKEIVTLHGGSMKVESVEGQGSTFTLCLPIVDQSG